jgi:hypothetical protein
MVRYPEEGWVSIPPHPRDAFLSHAGSIDCVSRPGRGLPLHGIKTDIEIETGRASL